MCYGGLGDCSSGDDGLELFEHDDDDEGAEIGERSREGDWEVGDVCDEDGDAVFRSKFRSENIGILHVNFYQDIRGCEETEAASNQM